MRSEQQAPPMRPSDEVKREQLALARAQGEAFGRAVENEIQPGEGCVTAQVLTTPSAAVAVPRADRAEVARTTETRACGT